jgi:hypothetical protein
MLEGTPRQYCYVCITNTCYTDITNAGKNPALMLERDFALTPFTVMN